MTVPRLLLVVFGIALALAASVLTLAWLIPPTIEAEIRNRFAAITPLFILIFGAAATLAAAIATVTVARLSTDVLSRQARLETYIRMQDELDAIAQLYANLASALSHVIAAGFQIVAALIKIDNSNPRVDLFKQIPPDLSIGTKLFVNTLDDLDHALHQLQLNPVALHLFNSQIDKLTMPYSALQHIRHQSRQIVPEDDDEISKLDIPTMRLYLHFCRESLKETGKVASMLAYAHGTTLLHGGYKRPVPGPVTWVAFTGYLIFTSSVRSNEGHDYIKSLGLAMLHDLFFSFPAPEDVITHIRKKLNGYDTEAVYSFQPNDVLPTRFQDGMYGLQARPDLVFFKPPFPMPQPGGG